MTTPYYEDEHVTLYLGDCLEVDEWLTADVLVTDPPYGIGWRLPSLPPHRSDPKRARTPAPHPGIASDKDTSVRDDALRKWCVKPACMFSATNAPPPPNVKQTLVWQKPFTTGIFGTVAGFRRDWEAIHLMGNFPASVAESSSIIRTNGHHTSYLNGEHPHAKPVAVLELLISHCPPGVIADPFAGSGSTLVAARNLGRKVIGVELEEKYCEIAAKRLAQMCLDFEAVRL